jgi:hypothetical protein
MDAPEKIYVNTNDHLTNNGFYAFTKKVGENDIEYTRTDVFVEKACAWIENNFNMPNDFKEHFKKAMKL